MVRLFYVCTPIFFSLAKASFMYTHTHFFSLFARFPLPGAFVYNNEKTKQKKRGKRVKEDGQSMIWGSFRLFLPHHLPRLLYTRSQTKEKDVTHANRHTHNAHVESIYSRTEEHVEGFFFTREIKDSHIHHMKEKIDIESGGHTSKIMGLQTHPPQL